LLRLQDHGYLDERFRIIDQLRDKWASDVHEPPDYVTACVFRELATGKVLPYVHFLGNSPLRKKESEAKYFFRVSWVETHQKNVPSPRDVVVALRAMQRKLEVLGSESCLPPAVQIMVVEDAELYYLDIPIAIQKNDGEFRIADPFGNGFSLELESAFNCLLEQDNRVRDWLMSWKTSLANISPDNQPVARREPYDNDDNQTRYPELIANLRIRQDRQFRSIEQIHASIEWALFYSCVQGEYFSAVQQLRLTSQAEHSGLLSKAAEALSLALPQGGLPPVKEGKLNDFLLGKAELGTVLSLSLLMAADDASHPLRHVSKAYPDFIERLFKIKRERDESAHGVSKIRSTGVELPDDLFMREFVTTLLPSIQFSDTPISPSCPETISDGLLDARTSIQSEFGFALFNRFDTNLRDRLINAERFWRSCKDGDDALVFVCDLYAALQIAFRNSLTGLLPPDIRESEYIGTAQEKAKACGLGVLPDCLLTVKRNAIRETLLGNDQTLQSCFIAFLLVSDSERLIAIAQIQPTLVPDVARLIEARGHGNQPSPMSKSDIHNLRKSAYTIVKTLMEV